MHVHAGNVDRQPAEGLTATGAQKETFGTGSAAQSEAGKKGGAISGKQAASSKCAGLCRYGRQRWACLSPSVELYSIELNLTDLIVCSCTLGGGPQGSRAEGS